MKREAIFVLFRAFIFVVVATLLAGRADATGASGRYSIEIDGGYKLWGFKNSSMELVRLGPRPQAIIAVTGNSADGTDPRVGPLREYAVTETHIFTRNTARVHVNDPPNPGWHLDPSRDYFFVVRKTDAVVTGPLSHADFEAHPAVQGLRIRWETPRTTGDSWIGNLILGAVLCWPATLLVALFIFCLILYLLMTFPRREKLATPNNREVPANGQDL